MTQTEFSGFFNPTPNNARAYDDVDLAELMKTIASDGVFKLDANLEVTADGSGMTVSVSPDSTLGVGRAMIQGYWYKLIASNTLTIPDADSTYDRIDRIILRLNKVLDEASPIQLIVLQGMPAETPTPPEISNSGNIWDLSLAQVYVTAGVSVIAADKITDEREDIDVCGVMHAANHEAVIDSWLSSVQTDFNAWYAGVQSDVINKKTMTRRAFLLGRSTMF